MARPHLPETKKLVAIKGFEILPVIFQNEGSAVSSCTVNPSLPIGLNIFVEEKTCVISGVPMHVTPSQYYTITASNDDGSQQIQIEIAVVEAAIQSQRSDIIREHSERADLDTPRSQVAHATQDANIYSSHIKPHEKFAHQPMGDDNRLSQQTAANPEAEERARNTPELTPSPTPELQQQAILRANPNMTPTPTR